MAVPVWDDIVSLSGKLAAGEFSSVDLTRAYQTRIERYNPELNAFTNVCRDVALVEAAAADARRQAGATLGPLDGIPIAAKDNIAIKGLPWTAGMEARRSVKAAEDAFSIARLRGAGAVILGTLNMEEAALGATTDNPHFGKTHNPHRHGFSPAGSSGGSAAAVAAALCAGALGTDTLGSVRLPATYCGVAGLKPAFGRISTRGVVPLSTRFDHVGPLTRSVRDLALMLDVMAAIDPDAPDSTGNAPGTGFGPGDDPSISGVRIAMLGNHCGVDVTVDVSALFDNAVSILGECGAVVSTVEFEGLDLTVARRAGLTLTLVEGAEIFREEMKTGAGLSPHLLTLLNFGKNATPEKQAVSEQRLQTLRDTFASLFENHDAVITPTSPQTAFSFAEKGPENQADFTGIANMIGASALSVPAGFCSDGLPVGLQVMTPNGGEALAFQIARAFERAANLDMRPRAMIENQE
jgi:aspartyl-tRNA(Asn)/glutamyl-tRNA(Gln) amidotransferase subunit A